MASDEAKLEQLKARMSTQQRQDMAELVSNELKRRQSLGTSDGRAGKATQASGGAARNQGSMASGLSRDDIGELYGQVSDTVQKLKVQKLENQIAEAKRDAKKMSRWGKLPKARQTVAETGDGFRAFPFAPQTILTLFVVTLGLAKIGDTLGWFDPATAIAVLPPEAEEQVPEPRSTQRAALGTVDDAPKANAEKPRTPARQSSLSIEERDLRADLDSRRAELEKRREGLDRREQEIKEQATSLQDRVQELRALTAKISEAKKERDHRYEARLEQLATVYGSMGPNEAAPLIGRLDENIALALLERMPGKRMGQILSVMEKERAIALTKGLTDRRVD